uniref:Photosystem I reaction center subunit XII n=1 Tax=Ochromonas sp. CCMP1393 TaxID=420556 RepID=A0A0D3MKF1_9STRA|nr:photosystem I reaction center subunit XII [Ochromonas sp. CCMP1393]AIM52825.1 photosystem I reaction center subunit XII [Ochromonas sp. CCMP1393]
MVTEINIYTALLLASLLLTFSIRLGFSLYQSV